MCLSWYALTFVGFSQALCCIRICPIRLQHCSPCEVKYLNTHLVRVMCINPMEVIVFLKDKNKQPFSAKAHAVQFLFFPSNKLLIQNHGHLSPWDLTIQVTCQFQVMKSTTKTKDSSKTQSFKIFCNLLEPKLRN